MRRWTVRALGMGLVATTLLGPGSLVVAHAALPVLVLDGSGYGHGVGLSQWGAEHLARTGRSVQQILGTFYPGASLGTATGPVRVTVDSSAVSTTTLTFPRGGEVRSALQGEQAPGFPVRVGPGGRIRITFDGAYHADAVVSGRSSSAPTRYRQQPCPLLAVCTPSPSTPTTVAPTTTAPPPPSDDGGGADGGGGGADAPPSPSPSAPRPRGGAATADDPLWAVPIEGGVTTVDDRGRSYRGVLEAVGGGGLRLVNLLGVEDYLRGMGEVPGTWPAAAVQAQTVAARTYALRAMQAGGELCDDARCQVYIGQGAESPGQDAAVAATARWVLTYGGSLAAAVYSADAGGISATTLEGFGTPDGVYPYLTTVRYDTDNAFPWHLTLGLDDVASRLGYRGHLTSVRVGSTGPSGRALDLVLDGSTGEMTVSGLQFARGLGLRSTRFTASLGSADAAPPPPPAEEALQTPPDQATALAVQPVHPADGTRLGRHAPAGAAAMAPRPPGPDPRWHLATLVAVLALAGTAGAHGLLARDRRRRRA